MTQEELQEIVVRITPFLGRKESRSITDILTDCDVPLCKEKAQLIFWIVWEWATKQGWWNDFMRYTDKMWREAENTYINRPFVSINKWLIHPTRFPQLITDFLREKGEGDGTRNL